MDQLSTTKPIIIDMVSDFVCPWCFIGLKSLQRALPQISEHMPAAVRFRPYQLNPDTPTGGVDRAAYYERKFPDKEMREAARARMTESATAMGVEFDPGLPTILPNTLLAHQLISYAQQCGPGAALIDALYTAYWTRGADIGDFNTLVELASGAGVTSETMADDLAAISGAVLTEIEGFRAAGVTGVPTFIVNERTGFSGALPPDNLAEAILQAAAR